MEIIYANDIKNGLSKNGTIPWKSKTDMSFFVNKTKNNIVIMGKNTFFSIPKEHRPLKNRLNIILTSNPHFYKNNIEDSNILFTNNTDIHKYILQNRNEYYKQYKYLTDDFKIFIIGGKSIYDQFIPLCNTIWVTCIKSDHNCDLFIDYDYSKCFESTLYEDTDELKIVKYTRI
jgi:dihydrofolate reductase